MAKLTIEANKVEGLENVQSTLSKDKDELTVWLSQFSLIVDASQRS